MFNGISGKLLCSLAIAALQNNLRAIRGSDSPQFLVVDGGRAQLLIYLGKHSFRFGEAANQIKRTAVAQLKARTALDCFLRQRLDPGEIAPEIATRPQQGFASGFGERMSTETGITTSASIAALASLPSTSRASATNWCVPVATSAVRHTTW